MVGVMGKAGIKGMILDDQSGVSRSMQGKGAHDMLQRFCHIGKGGVIADLCITAEL